METKSPVILANGKGKEINALGRQLFCLAAKEETHGSWSCVEYNAPPNAAGPPAHYHKEMEEAFYVIEGTLTVNINGVESELTAGGFVNIPPGNVHTFSNNKDVPLKVLLLMCPGGFENYFIELNELVKTLQQWPPADMGPFMKLLTKYDTYLPE